MDKKSKKPEALAATHPHPKSSPPRRRRSLRVLLLLALLVLPAIAVWFLPPIVAHSSLLAGVIARVANDLNGSVRVGGASLDWLSPVVLTNVEICDAQGEIVLQVPRVAGSQRLIGLLFDRRHLGVFRLEQPQLKVVLRPDGSNLEDMLARYLGKENPEPVEISLAVVDGRVSIQDAAGGQPWAIEGLQLALQTPADDATPLKAHAAGALADPVRPGQFDVAFEVPSRAARSSAAHGSSEVGQSQAVIDAQGLSAEMFSPLVARFVPGWRCAGRLSPKIRCAWSGSASDLRLTIDGQVTAEKLVAGGPALGPDQVRLDRLEATCQGEWSAGQAVVRQLRVRCDVGELSGSGTFVAGQLLQLKSLDALRRQTFNLSTQVDLARLAQMLPTALRIQQGTQIVSGKVQAALASRQGDQGMVWDGKLEAVDVKALQNGRSLTWDQPVLVTFTASDTPQGITVDKLQCRSTFLNVEGSGTAERLNASGRFDLGQLIGQLEQFVDLGGLRLAGEGSGDVGWKRQGVEGYQATVQFQLRDFRLTRPGQEPWTEQKLVLSLTATGATDFRTTARVDSATLHLESEPDRIDAQLTGPVGSFADGGVWPLEIEARGRLEGWLPRLKSWLTVGVWKPSGAFELTGKASISRDRLQIEQAKVGLSQFALQGPSVSVQEPSVDLVLSGGWDRPGRQVWLPQGTFATNGLTVTATDLKLAMPQQGPFALSGVVKYQGHLERLQQWIPGLTGEKGWRLAGEISGDGQFEQSARMTTALLNAKVNDLTLVRGKDGQQFAEPQIAFLAKGTYDGQAQILDVQQFDLGSSFLAGSVKGRITPGEKQPAVDFSGTLQYDLDRVCGILRPYLDSQTRFVGRGASPALLRGPLSLAELQGELALEWVTGYIKGFRLGAGRVKVSLANGSLRTEPIALDVSEGKVQVSPVVRLTATPRDLVIEPGPVAQQIRIDPEMCENALKYGAPVLAGVATAEGRFSVQLTSCRIPLDDPRRAEMAGQVTIHSLQIGPGYLIREMATGLGLAGSAAIKQQSVIPFEVRDGRVHHQNMELMFPEMKIRTSGSVGFDQTLNLTAEMSLPPRWLGNNVLGTAMGNQMIRVPISGTLERPTLSRDALREISRQAITGAARGFLESTKQLQNDLLTKPQK